MLEKMGKEIDGVIIGTPDHTHAVIAMEAMRHGKHVYCEKPLAHSVDEVRKLTAAAHEHKVITQLGNQGHSSGSIRQVCEWVWAGAIGQVHTIHAGCDAFKNVYCQIPNLAKVNEAHEVPATLDYDLWVGPGAIPSLLTALGALELARLDAFRWRRHRRLDLSRRRSGLLGAGFGGALDRASGGN
jgi:hypothetical protein